MEYKEGMAVRITGHNIFSPSGTLGTIKEIVQQAGNGSNALLKVEVSDTPGLLLVWGEGPRNISEIEIVSYEDLKTEKPKLKVIVGRYYEFGIGDSRYYGKLMTIRSSSIFEAGPWKVADDFTNTSIQEKPGYFTKVFRELTYKEIDDNFSKKIERDGIEGIVGRFYIASVTGEKYDYIIRLDSNPGSQGYTRYNSSLWVHTGTYRGVVQREGGFHALQREATEVEVRSYFKDFISQTKTEANVSRQNNEGDLRSIPSSKREGKRRSENSVQSRKGKVKLAICDPSDQGRISGCKVKGGRVKVGIPT